MGFDRSLPTLLGAERYVLGLSRALTSAWDRHTWAAVWLCGSLLVPDTPAPSPMPPQTDASGSAGSSAPSPLIHLGRRITTARQAQGLSIETLASRLRLGTDQLEALEHADSSRLPEPVFVIAQARRVAASLGLDVDDDLAALRASATTKAARIVPALAAPAQPAAPQSPSFPLRPALVLGGLALAGVLAAAALLLVRPWARTPATASTPAASTATAPTPPSPSDAATTAAAATRASDELVLTITGPSWIAVRDAAGRTLFQGTLREGEKRFPLGDGLRVMAGRPDLVSASVAGGPARVLGTISAVQWRGFNRSSPDPVSLPAAPPVAPPAAAAAPASAPDAPAPAPAVPAPPPVSPPGAPAP